MNNHQQQQQNMGGSGLTRYRSAPSPYFDSLLNTNTSNGEDDFEQILNSRALSPETQEIFSRFMNNNNNNNSETLIIPVQSQPQLYSEFLAPRNKQLQLHRQQINDYSSVSQIMHNQENINSSSAMQNLYRGLLGSNCVAQMKMESGGVSGLIRHCSSPAGLFANINIEKEFGAMRDMVNYGAGNSSNADASFSSASRFKSEHINFSAKQFNANNDGFTPSFPINSWDDSGVFADKFLNENATDDQNREGGRKRPTTRLSHHLSMPTSSSDFSAMENLLKDSIPCKVRAKRGCATHPRSISERVRRTKISERMRKLQELVPNMEKQTNTADMLGLAVDYIKDLQTEVEKLTDAQSKCSFCSLTN